jgi:hypothetical protein
VADLSGGHVQITFTALSRMFMSWRVSSDSDIIRDQLYLHSIGVISDEEFGTRVRFLEHKERRLALVKELSAREIKDLLFMLRLSPGEMRDMLLHEVLTQRAEVYGLDTKDVKYGQLSQKIGEWVTGQKPPMPKKRSRR